MTMTTSLTTSSRLSSIRRSGPAQTAVSLLLLLTLWVVTTGVLGVPGYT